MKFRDIIIKDYNKLRRGSR